MRAIFRIRRAGLLIALFIMLSWPSATRADVYINQPHVTLSWAANPEPDVKGYEILRSNSLDGDYVKAHEGLITDTSWTDSEVTDGSTYYYKLRAVDLCGNASGLSAPSDAVVIQLTE